MKNIIEELWNGEINPQDTLVDNNPHYKELQPIPLGISYNHLHKKFRFVDNSLYHKSINFSIYITQLTWKEIPPSEGLSRRSFFYSLSAS